MLNRSQNRKKFYTLLSLYCCNLQHYGMDPTTMGNTQHQQGKEQEVFIAKYFRILAIYTQLQQYTVGLPPMIIAALSGIGLQFPLPENALKSLENFLKTTQEQMNVLIKKQQDPVKNTTTKEPVEIESINNTDNTKKENSMGLIVNLEWPTETIITKIKKIIDQNKNTNITHYTINVQSTSQKYEPEILFELLKKYIFDPKKNNNKNQKVLRFNLNLPKEDTSPAFSDILNMVAPHLKEDIPLVIEVNSRFPLKVDIATILPYRNTPVVSNQEVSIKCSGYFVKDGKEVVNIKTICLEDSVLSPKIVVVDPNNRTVREFCALQKPPTQIEQIEVDMTNNNKNQNFNTTQEQEQIGKDVSIKIKIDSSRELPKIIRYLHTLFDHCGFNKICKVELAIDASSARCLSMLNFLAEYFRGCPHLDITLSGNVFCLDENRYKRTCINQGEFVALHMMLALMAHLFPNINYCQLNMTSVVVDESTVIPWICTVLALYLKIPDARGAKQNKSEKKKTTMPPIIINNINMSLTIPNNLKQLRDEFDKRGHEALMVLMTFASLEPEQEKINPLIKILSSDEPEKKEGEQRRLCIAMESINKNEKDICAYYGPPNEAEHKLMLYSAKFKKD